MAYIVQRRDRFYVVDYDGIDPITGRERRRWRLVGCDRTEAEELAARLEAQRADAQPRRSPTSLGGFLVETWLPRKRAHVRATTQYRYTWIVQHYLLPHLGDYLLDERIAEALQILVPRVGRPSG